MEAIINKVRKLFALAENNNSEEEAQAALEMARKLLQDHGLSMMDLKVEEKKESLAGEVEVELEGKKRLAVWMLTLGDVIAHYFEVGFLHRNSMYGHKLWFFGNRANCQAATIAMPSLVSQIESLAKSFKTREMELYKSAKLTKKLKESYRLGLIKGFAIHLNFLKEKEQENTQTTALAVFNEDLQQAWLDSQNWKIKTVNRPRKTVQAEAYQKGQQDSYKLSLGSMLEEKS